MVARIKTGKTMRGVISYNENKVTSAQASCIAAINFGKDASTLSFHEKLNRFHHLTRWNQKVRTNTVHISLNFDPSEQLSRQVLEQISSTYISKIGFADQPYLVYQHFDAAHPHVHIVTTNIKSTGKAINLHNLGRLKSEPARKAIEIEFKLVRASTKTRKIGTTQPTVTQYGKAETKRTIASVVGFIATSYRYTSLPELNAALKQFNIIAHRGNENSVMFRKGGLVYSFIGKDGKPKGVSIKASALHFKPTLKFIEKQFRLNEVLRQSSRHTLAQKITQAFSGRPTIHEFQERLRHEQIIPVLRHAKDNRIFGITFVDQKNKVVFNGSDLSKQLSAKNILDQLKPVFPGSSASSSKITHQFIDAIEPIDTTSLFSPLIALTEVEDAFIPPTPSAFKRKRKRRNQQKR